MKLKEPKTMQELHRIHEQIHEEMKNLPPGERSRRINANARNLAAKYNLKLRFIDRP